MSIDLAKVPEGATHYNHENEEFYASWYKVVNGEITHYNEFGDMWIQASDSCVFPKVSDLQAIGSRWTGEGPPPVGIKVMTDLGTVMTECEVIGYYQKCDGGESWVVVALPTASKESRFIADRLVSQVFPIRTPEQIAAEKRIEEINEMAELSLYGHYAITLAQAKIACAVLHDKGYRKVTP